MSFIDRSTLVVDAVLTKVGRQRLSENNFIVDKFALGDDEIDYSLYNEANTGGPNNYGIIIENMPIHQAFTATDLALQYKLVTQSLGDNNSPSIAESVPATLTVTGEGDAIVISPGTLNGFGDEDYIFELASNQDVTITPGNVLEGTE